ncbi:MAG: hypothetical protein O2905_02125 [Proteobacteria bacterium]|nr:hypothetical protein [Pseudomonadota bacterium]
MFPKLLPRILLALVVGVVIAACDSNDFTGDVAQYIVEPNEELPFGGYIRHGKVLVIDVDNGVLDPIHDRLPKEIRARTPDEVGTVALVECLHTEVGTYFFWAKGYSTYCDATLIDWPTRQILAGIGVTNSPPRKTFFFLWSHTASRPTKSIARSIAELGETPPPDLPPPSP